MGSVRLQSKHFYFQIWCTKISDICALWYHSEENKCAREINAHLRMPWTSGAVSLSEEQISECWQQMTAMNYFLFLLVGGKAPFQQELQGTVRWPEHQCVCQKTWSSVFAYLLCELCLGFFSHINCSSSSVIVRDTAVFPADREALHGHLYFGNLLE